MRCRNSKFGRFWTRINFFDAVAKGVAPETIRLESGQLGPFQSRPPANSAHTNYKPY